MRYHGLDLHKGSAAVSIRDEVGHEVRYLARVETASYVATLGPQDTVALESGCGSFWWAERIQRRGARCIVIDPYRFRIIRDSWHKTDRHDAGALSLGLWTSAQSGELVLPEVWQPTPEVRELRRLFSQWQILNNQSRQLKAQVQSVLVPTVRSSGGTTHVGRLNRRSRSLARTLFTEAVLHLADSSPQLGQFHRELVQRKGYGRARIAILRKTFGMMRRMLLSNTPYRWKEESLYQSKLKDWVRIRSMEEKSKIPA